jgi:Rrf2 family nitric oxide-sensitive transcriptional repressor
MTNFESGKITTANSHPLLGRQEPGQDVDVEQIANQLGGLSRNHLRKIVQDLAALGILRTV